jgi:hypothetical protein
MATSAQAISWLHSLDNALGLAKSAHQDVLLDFTAAPM